MEKIFNKVSEIIQDLLGLQPNEVTMEARLDEELGADSSDVIELVLYLESEFKTDIPDKEVDKLKTVQDICTYLDTNTEG